MDPRLDRRRSRRRATLTALLALAAVVIGWRCIADRDGDEDGVSPSAAGVRSDERRARIERARKALRPELALAALEGRVIDERGEPVADAEVILADPPRTTRSDRSGTFRFAELTDRAYVLEARAGEAYAGPLHARVASPVTLRLYAAGSVEVTCIAATTGAALANARAGIRMHSMFPGAVDVEARTDASGIARFRGMPAAGLEGWCAAEGHELRARFVDSTQEGTWRVEIPLVAGTPVRGRVVDEVGRAVAGATIEIAPGVMPMLAGVKGATRSADDGTFVIPGVGAGAWIVHADHPRYAIGTAAVTVTSGSPEPVTVVVRDGIRLGGVVVSRTDEPVPGARVEVRFQAGGRLFRTAQADGTGRFTVPGLPADGLLVRALTDDAASAPAVVDTRDGRGVDDLLLQLEDDRVVRGVVVDANERPLPDVSVFYVHDTREDDRATPAGVAVTGEDGRFELGGLAEGATYVLTAMRPGHFASVSLAMRSVGVRARAGDEVVVRFPQTGAVRGRVVLAGGELASVRVHLGGTPQPVGADGSFVIRDLPPEIHALTVDGPGLLEVVRGKIEVRAGETVDVGDLAIERGRQVRGTVRDVAGRPIGGARVRFVPVGINGQLVAETDEAGRYARVLPKTHDCDVSAIAGGLGTTAPKRLAAGASAATLDFAFGETGRIVGVVRHGGEPARGRVVLLDREPDGPPAHVETTEADGRFELVVAAGTYRVSLLEQDGGTERYIDRTVTVAAGAVAHVDFP